MEKVEIHEETYAILAARASQRDMEPNSYICHVLDQFAERIEPIVERDLAGEEPTIEARLRALGYLDSN